MFRHEESSLIFFRKIQKSLDFFSKMSYNRNMKDLNQESNPSPAQEVLAGKNIKVNQEMMKKFDAIVAIIFTRIVELQKISKRPDGFCWQTAEDWEEYCGITYTQVRRAVAILVENGYIETKIKRIIHTGYTATHYRVIGLQTPPKKSEEAEKSTKELTPYERLQIESAKLPVEAKRLSNRLFEHMVNNNPTYQHRVKDKDLVSWAKEIDKIHRLDGQEWSEIEAILDWCQSNDFWKTNILSGAKFRKQFPRLQLQKGSEKVFLM